MEFKLDGKALSTLQHCYTFILLTVYRLAQNRTMFLYAFKYQTIIEIVLLSEKERK